MNVPLTLNLPVIRGNQAEHEDALLHPLLICRILHIMASNKMFRNNMWHSSFLPDPPTDICRFAHNIQPSPIYLPMSDGRLRSTEPSPYARCKFCFFLPFYPAFLCFLGSFSYSTIFSWNMFTKAFTSGVISQLCEPLHWSTLPFHSNV